MVTGGLADGLNAGEKLVAITAPICPEIGIVSDLASRPSVHPPRPAGQTGDRGFVHEFASSRVFPAGADVVERRRDRGAGVRTAIGGVR